jgi:nucleoside 2-deoxyribosyltransferase
VLKGPIYVAGPMSHYPDYNRSAFEHACARLRACGFEVLSPHENGHPGPEVDPESVWAYYMKLDLHMVADANLIAVLDGWECSRGARIEVQIAHSMHIPVLPLDRILAIVGTQTQ